MSKELKPCPFCGGEAKMYSKEIKLTQMLDKHVTFHNVICESCGATAGVFFPTEADARNVWNRRVKPMVRGEWIKLGMHCGEEQYKCSACGMECYVPECMYEPLYAFCPNCGADMRNKEEQT